MKWNGMEWNGLEWSGMTKEARADSEWIPRLEPTS